MLTNQDIAKLKTIFVTKEDLRRELKNELAKYVTKDDFVRVTGDILDLIQSFRLEMNERFETLFDHINESNATLNNHERRIEKLEEKVFSPS